MSFHYETCWEKEKKERKRKEQQQTNKPNRKNGEKQNTSEPKNKISSKRICVSARARLCAKIHFDRRLTSRKLNQFNITPIQFIQLSLFGLLSCCCIVRCINRISFSLSLCCWRCYSILLFIIVGNILQRYFSFSDMCICISWRAREMVVKKNMQTCTHSRRKQLTMILV